MIHGPSSYWVGKPPAVGAGPKVCALSAGHWTSRRAMYAQPPASQIDELSSDDLIRMALEESDD